MTAGAAGIDLPFIVATVGGFVGIAVGLITIIAYIKKNREKSKSDTEASNMASESRMKDFFKFELKIVETKVDGINERVERIESQLDGDRKSPIRRRR